LSGAFPPSEGTVVFEGKNLAGLKPHQFSHAGISKSFQITSIFPNFTTLQNVEIALQSHVSRYNLWRKQSSLRLDDKAMELLRTVGMEQHAHRLASELAHGQQR